MQTEHSSLTSYLADLQAKGQVTFTRQEAVSALGVTKAAFLKATARLRERNMLLNPRHGFYIIIPPQFRSWEAPPPTWYIDALMRYEGRLYYVGLLKAAEMHGASHQAVMDFQVVTDKQQRKIRAGRSWITFHFRKDIEHVSAGITERKTDTGRMKVSTPELTALDLLRYMHVVGGIDAIATILVDLAPLLNGQKLAELARAFERAAVQRLGYLLERMNFTDRAEHLHDLLWEKPLSWVPLEPTRRGLPVANPKPIERNERWRVRVLRYPETDQ